MSKTTINFFYSHAFLVTHLFLISANLDAVITHSRKPCAKYFRTSCFSNRNVTNVYDVGIYCTTCSCNVPDCKKSDKSGASYMCCTEHKRRSKRGLVGNVEQVLKVEEVEVKEIVGDVADLWWPNDSGEWQQCILNCPFALNVTVAFEEHPVRFFLYTRNNTNYSDYDILTDNVESLQQSEFINGAPVKIITHGFLSNGMTGPTMYLREFYNKLPYPINIISVDWEALAAMTNFGIPCYNQAVKLTKLVGERTAELMKFLIVQNTTTIKDVHMIGHSLGAHISGFLCKAFASYSMGKCSRVTGLDPAGPLFVDSHPSGRLDYTDADFVDVIHTATTDLDIIPGSLVKTIELGLVRPIGHSDFYPNRGGNQPGCEILVYPLSCPGCSHSRSYFLYAESIKPQSNKIFRATLCDTLEQAEAGECIGADETQMGEYTDFNNGSRNIYYVKTNSLSPFAQDDL